MFAGEFSRGPQAGAPDAGLGPALLALLDGHGQAHASGSRQIGPFVLAHTLIHNTHENLLEQTPYVCPDSGLMVAAWARLDRREELAAELGLQRPLHEVSDPMLILAAWRRWGCACASRLQGDFSFAIVDVQAGQLFLARDPVGVRPLYYRLDAVSCRFSTSAAPFARLQAWRAEPDLDWAAAYLMGGCAYTSSRTGTAYRQVLRLEPGHWLRVDAQQSELNAYFHFRDDAPVASRRDERWVLAYREVLETVIREQMRSDHALGVENSGGIDSATLTSFIARELGEHVGRLSCFAYALGALEPSFILETSQAHRILHNHILTARPPRSDELYERGLSVLGYPEEHGNACGHDTFYRLCRGSGIRTLFSGFGGDEVVTNPGEHLRWELLDQADYRALWDLMPGPAPLRGLRLLKAVLTSKRRPSHHPGLLAAMQSRLPHLLVRAEVAQRLRLVEQHIESTRFDATYRRINDFALAGRLHAAFVPARLESCSLMAQSYGVDYRWPLLDTRLIQQYLSTPSVEKFGPGGIGRYLHRRAISGVVPTRVAWKPSKDMGHGAERQYRREHAIVEVAREGARQEAHLHPALEALVDRDKLRAQIAVASQGHTDAAFAFVFRRSVDALRWLNHWLHGRPVD